MKRWFSVLAVLTFALMVCAAAGEEALLDNLLTEIDSLAEETKALEVGELSFELSEDRQSIFIDRPDIAGAEDFTIAYNIYDSDSNPVNYFYSLEERVAATPGYGGLFNVFVVVTDTATGEQKVQNIGWQTLSWPLGDSLTVSKATFEVSGDKKSIFVDRPEIHCKSGSVTIAYNIYDAKSNPVNFFYSTERRVAATPGYGGKFNIFIVVRDTVTGEQDVQNIGWQMLEEDYSDELVEPRPGEEWPVTIDGITYNIVNQRITATGMTQGLTELHIAETVYGRPLTVIGPNAFQNGSRLKGTLVIPDTVVMIGDSAFTNCGCSGTLKLPSRLREIGSYAFFYSTSFTGELVIPDTVQTIGSMAFSNDVGFTGLKLGDSLRVIGGSAFYGCTGMTGKLTIPSGVERIDQMAFYNCAGFTGDLIVPDSVTFVGDSAYQNCSGFTGRLTVGAKVTYIGQYAFKGCTGLTGRFSMGSLVEEIGEEAFRGLNVTGDVTIPATVRRTGDRIFAECRKLDGTVTILAQPNFGRSGLFVRCESIKKIVLGEGITQIPSQCFEACSSATELVLPEGLQNIQINAFSECRSLKSVKLPASLQTIGESAFYRCTSLSGRLEFGDTLSGIGIRAFTECTSLQSLSFGSGLIRIDDFAFADCTGLKGSLEFPASLLYIGSGTFSGCTGLSGTVHIPNGCYVSPTSFQGTPVQMVYD
ncbi:MAG: leucine-rich repeat domain-containing protein [Clostridia bacterium]|nr:leucine-rich repeat domain-containing protein [Clostridia bacterium]